MARIIDFYFPARYSPKPKQIKERGKLIEVPVRTVQRPARG